MFYPNTGIFRRGFSFKTNEVWCKLPLVINTTFNVCKYELFVFVFLPFC